jgi:ubiquinone/menaquinone biosynthesis C-methylase UbiE
MTTPDDLDAVRRHWDRGGLRAAIEEILRTTAPGSGMSTIEDLAPLDQFHGGGLGFTRRLADLAGLGPGMHVLDVGGGLGGPARTLAVERGCRVTVVDLAESYNDAGCLLTAHMGLDDRVSLLVGDALALPFPDGTFDVVWTQNSGMNIAAKERLYAGFRRVLAPTGVLAIQEPMAGPVAPPAYPLMWALEPAHDHVRSQAAMRAVIEAAGFRTLTWSEVQVERRSPGTPTPGHTIQRLVMGDEQLAAIMRATLVNEAERRLVMVQAVFAADPEA